MIRTYPRLVPSATSLRAIAHGNSLTAGTGSSAFEMWWTSQMKNYAPMLNSGASVYNRGVGGQSIKVDAGWGTMLNTGASAIDATLSATQRNVLMVLEYTNELKANGFNAAAAHDAMAEYCAARRAAAASAGKDLYIIVGTCPPAGGDPTGGGQTAIDARNNAMIATNALTRANYRDYADQLWDLAGEPVFAEIFANGDFSADVFINAKIWNRSDGVAIDKTHFGDSGYALIGKSAARAIARVRRI